MKQMLMTAIACFALVTAAIAAEETTWQTDYDAALVKAKKDGKDVLLVFVGSDWNQNSAQFQAAIMENKDFLAGVGGKFVLVVIDWTKNKPTPVAEKEKQKALILKFHVGDLPTGIAIDSDGKAFGEFSGCPDVPTSLKIADFFLGIKQKRDAAFTDASKKTGLERAEALQGGMVVLASGGLFRNGSLYGYEETINEIRKLDGLNTKQYCQIWDYYLMSSLTEVLAVQGKTDEALKEIDDFITRYSKNLDYVAEAMFLKASVYESAKKDEEMFKTLIGIVKIAPNSRAGKIASQIIEERKQAEQLAEQLLNAHPELKGKK